MVDQRVGFFLEGSSGCSGVSGRTTRAGSLLRLTCRCMSETERETERGLISHSSSLYVAVSLHNRNPIQTRRGARVLQGRADSTYSSSARLLCFLQKAHFSSTLIQDGKATVYSCQTQSLAPYSLKKRASTMLIFEPSFSLYPRRERPRLGRKQWIKIKIERHVSEVIRCNGLELRVR